MNHGFKHAYHNEQYEFDVIPHNKLPDLVLGKLMDWIMDGKLHMGEN